MYAIMLPHRAWAAGDTLFAILKLSPLAKGVRVENVVTTLWETTELHVHPHKNSLHLHDDNPKVVHSERRIVRCVKHEIVNGKAVRVNLVGSGSTKTSPSRPGSSMDHHSSSTILNTRAASDTFSLGCASVEEEDEESENNDIVTYITFPVPHLASGPDSGTHTIHTAASPPSMTPGLTTSASTQSRPPSPVLCFSSTYPHSPGPSGSTISPSVSSTSNATINPTHNVPPIVVSHRIRWSLTILNRDGHKSELRCSLPIHILDGKVLSEAREASMLTRKMTLVAEGLWRADEDEEHLGIGAAGAESNENGDYFVDRQLPSYTAHVKDRVANMYYSEMATVRVPWVDVAGSDGSATDNLNGDGSVGGGSSHPYQRLWRSSSEQNSTRNFPACSSNQPRHLPPDVPSASNSSSLDWVENTASATDGLQTPERDVRVINSRSSTGSDKTTGGGRSIRGLSTLLKATMKPFSALSHHHHGDGGHGLFGLPKSSPPQDDRHRFPSSDPSSSRPSSMRRATFCSSCTSRHHLLRPLTTSSIIQRSISEVPDYVIASQGFMGGVPPLSSLMGLPTYDEACLRELRADYNREHGSSTTSNHHGNGNSSLASLVVEGDVTVNVCRQTASDTDLRRFGGSLRVGNRQSSDGASTGNLNGKERN